MRKLGKVLGTRGHLSWLHSHSFHMPRLWSSRPLPLQRNVVKFWWLRSDCSVAFEIHYRSCCWMWLIKYWASASWGLSGRDQNDSEGTHKNCYISTYVLALLNMWPKFVSAWDVFFSFLCTRLLRWETKIPLQIGWKRIGKMWTEAEVEVAPIVIMLLPMELRYTGQFTMGR